MMDPFDKRCLDGNALFGVTGGHNHRSSVSFVVYLLVAISLSASLFMSDHYLSLVVAVVFITLVMAWYRPNYMLYALFGAVILMTDAVGEEVEEMAGTFYIADIKIIHGVPPLLVTVMLVLFVVFFTRFIVVDRKESIVPFRYLAVYLCIIAAELLYTALIGTKLDDIVKQDVTRLIYPVLCFYLCVNVLNEKGKIYAMLWVAFVACWIKALILDIYYLMGRGWPFEEYQIVTQDSAALMMAGIMASLLLLLLVINNRSKYVPLLVIASLPLIFALVFSYRRAHWIGQVLSLALIFHWGTALVRTRMTYLVAGALLLSAIPLTIMGGDSAAGQQGLSNIASRLSTLFDPGQHSNQHHYLEARVTMEDILHQPLFGLGLGSEHSPVPETIVDWPEEHQPLHIVHNAFIYIWMKLGLPGLAFFVWAALRYLKALREYFGRRSHGNGWPFIVGMGSGAGIWLMMFLTGPVPWFVHQTFLIALVSALTINLIRLENDHLGSARQSFR